MTSGNLFSGVTSGLTNTYSILTSATGGNVTASTIATAMSSSTYASSLGSGFASYILSNFNTLDKNHDGILSAAELSSLTSSIGATGLTSAQLSQLGTASGLSNETLEQVLEHFTEIDKNGDGKVTTAEINSYKLTSAMDQKKTEFANHAAKNQSIFYGDDSSSSEADSSSIMSYKYWNTGSGNKV